MYKKIKNGSFMNWIWFGLCILPFVLLLIYSISYFNKQTVNNTQTKPYPIHKRTIFNFFVHLL